MDSISNYPGMPKKSRLDKAKKQYKSAPTLGIPEGVSKRKELLNNRRKIAKTSILDAGRDLEVPDKEVPDKEVPDNKVPDKEVPDKEVPDKEVPNKEVPDKEVMNSKKQYKQRILQWRIQKEKQKKEGANKVIPFLTGAVKVPLYYVPPPPLTKNKQKDKVVNTNGREDKYNKQASNIPKISESNVTRSKKCQWLHSISSKKEKSQTVSKISQPKSQAGPSYQLKLQDKFSIKKKGSDNKITEKVISEEDATISKFQTQLNTEVDWILKMCASWDEISKTATIPGFVQEMVLGVTGQARLLVSQKMAQFRSLIEGSKKQNCPVMSGTGRVLSQDLHGFWDMIYLQVEDINKRFSKLEQLKTNNWEEKNPKENKKPSKQGYTKRAFKLQKKPVMSSRTRELIFEAKKKMMAMKHPGNEEAVSVETFDAGSFAIQWVTRKAKPQLELPSTSGTVPTQYASAPLFKNQKAVKKRRWELEPLEENCLEQEHSEEYMKQSKDIKPLASSDIRQFITQMEKASHVISPKKEFETKEISNISLINSEPKDNLPCTSSSNTLE